MRQNLTKKEAEKFIEGYNRCVDAWNNDISDSGKTPYRLSMQSLGYDYARGEILKLQLSGKGAFTVDQISTYEEANNIWLKG